MFVIKNPSSTKINQMHLFLTTGREVVVDSLTYNLLFNLNS